MADNKDKLEARRWFRRRLAELGTQYPELQEPERQQRLTQALEEEGNPCHDHRQEDPEDGQQGADN
jgi:hypothetical protein